MNYTIDPCDACWQKCQNEGGNINELNDCLIDTSTAFSDFPSNAAIRETVQGQEWRDCISKKMSTLPNMAAKPRSFCNFQLNMGPRWLQTPHYFPSFLKATRDPDKALKLCYQQCEQDRYSETCKLTCETDRNAVKKLSIPKTLSPSHSQETYKEKPNSQKKSKKTNSQKKSKKPTFEDEAKANPVSFWIVFAIVALILSGVLVAFFVALTSRNIGL